MITKCTLLETHEWNKTQSYHFGLPNSQPAKPAGRIEAKQKMKTKKEHPSQW